jgi:hypothetical protein
MFTVAERDRLRSRLLAYARTDDAIVGAAFTGSHGAGAEDRWSDTDLVLAVGGELSATVSRWTRWLSAEFGVLHHWDLTSGSSVIRVFLLPGWLEIDLTFAPEAEFGPRGPQWRTVFGQAVLLDPFPAPDVNTVIGLVWHHALHAWICLRRRRWWQAEHWISALRGHIITLACRRLGLPDAGHTKGAHLLPDDVTSPLEATLVRALSEPELHRALAAAIAVVTGELERSDDKVAARLCPLLNSLASRPGEAGQR